VWPDPRTDRPPTLGTTSAMASPTARHVGFGLHSANGYLRSREKNSLPSLASPLCCLPLSRSAPCHQTTRRRRSADRRSARRLQSLAEHNWSHRAGSRATPPPAVVADLAVAARWPGEMFGGARSFGVCGQHLNLWTPDDRHRGCANRCAVFECQQEWLAGQCNCLLP
jgi:hypothetical protein